jgi:cell division protein FtsQ
MRRAGRTRRRDRWKVPFFAIAAVGLVAGVAWALLGSSFFVARSVQVSGSAAVPRAAVLAAAGVRLGTPLISIDKSAVARRVERITQVQTARVTTSWPDAVVIWIRPRTAVLAVAAQGGFDRVDRYGVVLGWSSARPSELVLLASPPRPAGSLRGNEAIFSAGTVVSGLPAWLRHRVTAVRAVGATVTLLLRGGVTVTWGGPGRTAEKTAELAVLLRTGAGYYDVSDPVTAVTGLVVPGRSGRHGQDEHHAVQAGHLP